MEHCNNRKNVNAETKSGLIYLIGKNREEIKHFSKENYKTNNLAVMNLGTKYL